ncbi:MAG: S-layer homology domain-containing protein [Clostridia bacterium]|nr:S-layer homology domain-containing protein [Clostridia bacterium]
MKKTLMLISVVLAMLMLLPLASFAAKDGGDLPFADVKSGKWYYGNVKKVYETKLMNGVSSTEFDPNGTLTRGMCATILYRAANEPDVKAGSTFADVKDGKYYAEAVAWAQKNSIVNGRTASEFDPNGKITRAEFATMLYRFEAAQELALPATREGAPADADSVAKFAAQAVDTMYRSGVVNGRENGEFDPDASITRAEASAMVTRFLDAATVEETDEDTLTIGFFGDSTTIDSGMIEQFGAIAADKNVKLVQLSKEGCTPEQILAEWSNLMTYESNQEKIASLDVIVIAAVDTNVKYGRSIDRGEDYWVWQADEGYELELTAGATTEEILADVMAHGHNGPYEPVLPKIRALFGEDKEYYYFTWNSNFNYRAGEEEECIAKINAGFENWGFTFVNTHNNAHKAVAGLPTQEDLGAALNGYCSALYLYNAVYGETVADRSNGLLTDADIPGDDDAAYIAALKDAIQSVIDDPVGAIHANTQAADSAFAQFATQVLNNLIPYDVLPGDTVEAKDAYMAVLRDLVYDLCEKMDIDPAQFILD